MGACPRWNRGIWRCWVEFGHGNVVAGLMKRSAKEIEVLGVGDPAGLEAALGRLSSSTD